MKSRIVILVFVLALSGAVQAQTTYIVLEEDFEDLVLGTSPEESAGTPMVWTNIPSPGWIADNSGVPGFGDPANDGVTDWAGWAFAEKQFWINADFQRREEFDLGQGTVAVADPDEWDDSSHLTGSFNTWLITPSVDISRSTAGTLVLQFDSSWRPDSPQMAVINVEYDGGDSIEILRWTSDAGANFHDDNSTNETIIIDLDNPVGAQSAVISFGLLNCGNDWWWAIDNILMTAEPRLEVAYNPSPPNKATDLQPSDVVLSWKPGDFVGGLSPKHKVILSDNFDAVTSGIAVVATQDSNSYDPAGLLDFSTTYYWRIDEASGTTGWDEGSVWQFTTEPFANPIAGENITATAFSTHQPDLPPSVQIWR